MRCYRCQWEGPLASIVWTDTEAEEIRSKPLCLKCRVDKRRRIRDEGGRITGLVPSR